MHGANVNDAADILPPGAVPATSRMLTTRRCMSSSPLSTIQPLMSTSCNTLQTGLDPPAEWGTIWRIQFEPSKSQAMMTITRHHHQWPIPATSFGHGGLNVDETATIKLPGVVFDKSMSFRNHLRSVAMRAAQRLGFLRNACRVLDILRPAYGVQRVRQTPHGVQPAPLAWGGAAPHHLSQVDKIQRRALCLIGPGVVVYSLALRRTISGIRLIYKLMCGPRVPCLQTLLPPRPTHDPLPRIRPLLTASPDRKWPQLSAVTAPVPRRSPPIIRFPLHPNLEFPPPNFRVGESVKY